MANQPKKYKKFVATAATATLVASAIVPVASADAKFSDVKGTSYEEAVLALAEEGVVSGYADGTYKPYQSVKRSDVVKLLGKFLVSNGAKLPTYEEATLKGFPFNDLNKNTDKELVQYAALVKEAGVFTGYANGSLDPVANISRQQMASVLVKALDSIYDVNLIDEMNADKNFKSEITDIKGNYYEEAIKALEYAELTVVEQFRPIETLNRGQFANFLYRAIEHFVAETPAEVAVTAVAATNQNTLTLTGTSLNELKASDITVEGNGVASISASKDGKTATVTLTGVLASGKDTKVTVTVGGKAQNFTVKYTLVATGVAIQAQVFDDDTANQRLNVLVNGVATSVDYLVSTGYSVEFRAYNAQQQPTNNLLKDASGNGVTLNSTGALLTNKVPGEYFVQVVIKKGSEILTSPLTAVEVRNLDNAASNTEGLSLKTDDAKAMTVNSTLVVGESAVIDEFYVGNGQTVVKVKDLQNVKVQSSNNAVVSVKDQKITAVGLGSATITYTYGTATKTVSLNVVGAKRMPSSVSYAKGVFNPIVGGYGNVKVAVKDQYGDAYLPTLNQDVFITYPGTVEFTSAPTATVSTGAISHTFNAAKGDQSGTVVYKDAAGNVLGTLTLKTTAVNNKVSTKIEGGTFNGDNTINTFDERDMVAEFSLRQYNSENIFNGLITNAEVNGYTVKFDEKLVTVNDNNTGTATLTSSDLVVKPLKGKAGTTTIAVYDRDGKLVDQTTVTVVSGTAAINTVNWKNAGTINYVKKVNYMDVLDITKATNNVSDDIVNNLGLNIAPVNKVRITKQGVLYLDKNDNGVYNPGTAVDSDEYLGTLYAYVTTNTNNLPNHIGRANAVNGYDGIQAIAPSKGIITFAIIDGTLADGKVIATKDVNVDVLANAGNTPPPVTPPTAGESVVSLISALPAPAALTLENKAAVQAARTAYNALSDAEKAKVTNLGALQAAEAKIAELEAAAAPVQITTAEGYAANSTLVGLKAFSSYEIAGTVADASIENVELVLTYVASSKQQPKTITVPVKNKAFSLTLTDEEYAIQTVTVKAGDKEATKTIKGVVRP